VKRYGPEEDLMVIVIKQLGRIEHTLNMIKLGGTFLLLIVFCDYLMDAGWFGSGLQNFGSP